MVLQKIIAAIIITYIIIQTGGIGSAAGGWAMGAETVAVGGGVVAGSLTLPGSMAILLAANLALAGIQQIMAPDPAVDKNDGTTNYLFSGGASNAKEGDPIPLLYGELRVPGRPISIEVVQGSSTAYNIDNIYVDADGGVHNIRPEFFRHSVKES